MREIFEAINDYPWTTFFCFLMFIITLCTIDEIIKTFKNK